MPENQRKIPIPSVMNVAEFMAQFGSHQACVEHLRKVRWGQNLERFACPACRHTHGWWLARRGLVECSDCHRQTSVTAGTVFHRIRSPLWKWFWAIYQLAQDKKGIAAIELAKQISVSYSTAWLMLHKLRRLGGLDGHPDIATFGIEANSVSLGMGVSKGKGIAWAKQHLGRGGDVFVLTGDGELQEGQNYEAFQSAAHLGIGRLNVIVDHNKVQSDKLVTDIVDLSALEAKLTAFGWCVARCDGHDFG